MGMTVSQKILAAHCGKSSVEQGELIMAELDLVMGNDITSPVAIEEFEKHGKNAVWDNDKIAFVLDHFVPNKDIKSAGMAKQVREFARKHGIRKCYDVGEAGIEHALLPEKGLVASGDLVIGADSHTCTYGALGAFSTGIGSTDMAFGMAYGKAWFKVPSAIRVVLTGKKPHFVCGKDVILTLIGRIGVDGARYKSIEFFGDGVKELSMDDRFTVCNMAIECGAKNAVFPVDENTERYIREHGGKSKGAYYADADALYDAEYEIDLGSLEPTIALPYSPANVKLVSEVGRIPIQQVVIGSCTNGRLEDFASAAEVLKGGKVADGVRTIIIPATQKIYLDLIEKGYAKAFVEAGCIISMPTCGPCLGGYLGVLAEGERCVATTNRNFVGRMGHKTSEVYLASPAVAMASAMKGYVASPLDIEVRK